VNNQPQLQAGKVEKLSKVDMLARLRRTDGWSEETSGGVADDGWVENHKSVRKVVRAQRALVDLMAL
jgi:hypothetical protein